MDRFCRSEGLSRIYAIFGFHRQSFVIDNRRIHNDTQLQRYLVLRPIDLDRRENRELR